MSISTRVTKLESELINILSVIDHRFDSVTTIS